MATLASGEAARIRYLSNLLAPLDSQPEKLASRLLHRFGSISDLIDASESELRQCATYGERWIESFLVVRKLIDDGLRERVVRTNLDQGRENLTRYLLRSLRGLRHERLVAIFADAAGFILAEEVIAEGVEGHLELSARRLFGRALSLDARRIVLAHNHPSGNAEPSLADITLTKELREQGLQLGITIDDHLVVGKRAVVSLKDRGAL